MSDFGEQFVVDTNTLGQLGARRRASRFFSRNAVIPEEVLHEASGLPDISALRENVYPTTPRVLARLIEVLSTVPVDDTSLLNLYANLGNADPLVVACALDGREGDSQYLDPPDWIVVTGDMAVRAKAEEFGLTVRTNDEFAELIDEAEAAT